MHLLRNIDLNLELSCQLCMCCLWLVPLGNDARVVVKCPQYVLPNCTEISTNGNAAS
jgi:hypothetical protein